MSRTGFPRFENIAFLLFSSKIEKQVNSNSKSRYAREICKKKKLGQNVHQNSGVGTLCPPSKILCDLGQNVLGQNVLGAFCLGAFCLLGQNVLRQNVS